MKKKHRLRMMIYTGVTALVLVVAAWRTDLFEKLPVMGAKQTDTQTALFKAYGAFDQQVKAGDGYVVLSPVKNGAREVAYVGDKWQVTGKRYLLTGDAVSAQLTLDGGLVVIKTKKANAPQFAAYKFGSAGLEPVDYYTVKAPQPGVKTGTFVLVNKQLNALWHYENGKLVKAYRVATGRQTEGPAPTQNDFQTNFFTPEGNFSVSEFTVNPPYTALKPGDKSYPGGAPGNPLGTRWMGFSVYGWDGTGVWGIHGTSDPEKIGTWASDGCVRMYTNQAEELFANLKGKKPVLQIVSK